MLPVLARCLRLAAIGVVDVGSCSDTEFAHGDGPWESDISCAVCLDADSPSPDLVLRASVMGFLGSCAVSLLR